jgi:hypothetical protein
VAFLVALRFTECRIFIVQELQDTSWERKVFVAPTAIVFEKAVE